MVSFRAFANPPYSFSKNLVFILRKISTKLFINALSSLLNQNRGGSVVRRGLTPPLSTHYHKKCSKLSKMVQHVIKAPNLVQSCTMVGLYTNPYWKGNHLVTVAYDFVQSIFIPPYFLKKSLVIIFLNQVSRKVSTKLFDYAFSSLFK